MPKHFIGYQCIYCLFGLTFVYVWPIATLCTLWQRLFYGESKVIVNYVKVKIQCQKSRIDRLLKHVAFIAPCIECSGKIQRKTFIIGCGAQIKQDSTLGAALLDIATYKQIYSRHNKCSGLLVRVRERIYSVTITIDLWDA